MVGRYDIEEHWRGRSWGIDEERVGLGELKRRYSLQIRTAGLKGKGNIQGVFGLLVGRYEIEEHWRVRSCGNWRGDLLYRFTPLGWREKEIFRILSLLNGTILGKPFKNKLAFYMVNRPTSTVTGDPLDAPK